MRLKRLEIAGFKSFRNRTILDFAGGISAVVGPNGCGKSNIVDAVRWVMGEQRFKMLRAKKMEDVIFSGSNGASPVGTAEVSMILSSDGERFPGGYNDFSEVMISRRIFRDGETEYYINKAPCRLLDVREFFMDIGIGARTYSLVEQNHIANLVEAKPVERRNLIEEAAGIAKYKSRKEAASRKMEATRQNIVRLDDITGEVKIQIKSISLQAKKAERYKALKKTIKEEELALALQTCLDLAEKRKSLNDAYHETAVRRIEVETGLREIEASLEKINVAILENDSRNSKLQEKLYEIKNDVSISEQGIGFLKGKISEISERKQKNLSNIEMFQKRKENTLKELNILEKRVGGSDEKLTNIRDSVEKGQERAEELKGEERRLHKELEEKKIGHFDILTEKVSLKNLLTGLVKRGEDFKGRYKSYSSEIEENTQRLDSARDSLSSWRSSLQSDVEKLEYLTEAERTLLCKLEEARCKLGTVDGRIAGLKEETGIKSSRLSSLREFQGGYEWCSDGTRSIINAKSSRNGADYERFLEDFCGLVIDYIDVPGEYEVAVEAVLGEKLQYIVVSSHKDGIRAIDYLKSHSLGRGSFIPLSEIRENPSNVDMSSRGAGGGVKLIDVVGVKEGFEGMADYLLGDVVLTPDINTCLSLWERDGLEMTFVTPDGDVVSPHGVLTGGYGSNSESGLLRRKREIARIEEEVDNLSGLLKNEKDCRPEAGALVSRREEELTGLRSDLRKLELSINGKRKDIERFEGEQKWIGQRMNILAFNRESLKTEEAQAMKDKTAIENDIAACKDREIAADETISSLRERWEESRGKLEEMERGLSSEKVLLASLEEKKNADIKTLSGLKAAVTDISSEIVFKIKDVKFLEKEIEDITENIAGEKDRLEHLCSDHDVVGIEMERERESRSEKKEMLKKAETDAWKIKRELDNLTKKISEKEMESREVSSQISVLKEGMRGKYRVDLDSLKEEAGRFDESDIQRLRDKLDKDRKTLENFGEVNLLAPGEHEKLKERRDFLTSQVADLNSSLDVLQRTISKINRISKERFSETFTAVNQCFKEVFARLFRGGKGELRLTDELNMLETGVDIDIQLPGKKPRSISLLSGGEKSLSAVALIFSILLYRPSPFLMLDEADAALDDANILLFNKLIKDISVNSQIIIVTHNKNSMEVADNLLGITMEKEGISTMVSVNLN